MAARRLDKYQKEAVNSAVNTVVTAGAGSGKTTVLAHRFIHLVKSGQAKVESILTLTFTRKAAAEMYERIYRLLLQEKDAVAEGEERQRLERAVADFDQAQISTLDSFCARIVRGGSSKFGVPGNFRQDEYASSRLIHENALQFLLERSGARAIRSFVDEHGFENVLHQLLIPLANEQFHLAREERLQDMFENQLRFLKQQAAQLSRSLEEVQDWFLTQDLPNKTGVQKARAILEKSASPEDCLQRDDWDCLADIAARKLSSFGGNISDPLLLEAKEYIKQWQESSLALQPIAALFRARDLYTELYSLLEEFQRTVNEAKRSAGALTFRDVVEMAILLLEEELDLRDFYKRRYSHIMIDEFQDNNDLQRRLLFLLAEREELRSKGVPSAEELQRDKLFFVGDEKQSIYKFRGADVRVLKGLQHNLGKSSGANLQLPRNYRSHSGLIEFFNTLFEKIMPPAPATEDAAEPAASLAADPEAVGPDQTEAGVIGPDAADPGAEIPDFEAQFSPLKAPKEHTAFRPTIRLLYKPYDEDGADTGSQEDEPLLSSAEAEAWTAVKFLKREIGEGRLKVREGFDAEGREKYRTAVYDDVAILMRSSGNQVHFEKYLRRLQIPYSVQSIRSLFQDAPVNDIYQMLQLTVYPYDRTAYAAALRSPFARLSDDLIGRILLDRDEEGGERPAFSHTGEEVFFFSEAERQKYLRAKETYENLREMSKESPVGSLISFLWYQAGYRYVVLRNPDFHLYLEFYDALMALARLSESRGENLPVFLDFLRENLGDNQKLEDLNLIPRQSGGVQLMSIHASKGLEFPVVMVADMGNSGRNGSDRLFAWDEEYGLVIHTAEKKKGKKQKRNYFSESAAEKEKRQDAAELKRLFYVACTRAEDHLIFSGYHHKMNRKVDKPEGQSVLLNLLLQAFDWDGEAAVEDLAFPQGFDFQLIPDVSEEAVRRESSFSKSRNLEQVRELMEHSSAIERSFTRNEWTATALNQRSLSQSFFEAGPAHIQTGNMLVSPEVDRLLDENEAAPAFGELVHKHIEWTVKKLPGKAALPPVFADLEEKEIAELEQSAVKVSEHFFGTALGTEVKQASRSGSVESELPFVYRLDLDDGSESGMDGENGYVLVRGQIDLVLERQDEVAVVDFKTDRQPQPEHYAMQMEIYRRAAAELYGKPARSFLVYVRNGEVLETAASVDPLSILSSSYVE